MAGDTSWTLTLYGTTSAAAVGTTPDAYNMRTAAITALTALGAVSREVYILKPEHKPEITSEPITDIGGNEIAFVTRRGIFDVQSYPFQYTPTTDTAEQDLDDLIGLADVVSEYPHLYVRIKAGPRTYPSTTGTVYPVTVRSWDESLNVQQGNRTLAVQFAHKVRSI